jgi:hypothetical protein
MEFFYSLAAARTIFILGIVNLTLALLLFSSCRCVPGSRMGAWLMDRGPYKRFFRYHCHLWKVFWPSVAVHAFFALMSSGWPG